MMGGPTPLEQIWTSPDLLERIGGKGRFTLEVAVGTPTGQRAAILAGELDLLERVNVVDTRGGSIFGVESASEVRRRDDNLRQPVLRDAAGRPLTNDPYILPEILGLVGGLSLDDKPERGSAAFEKSIFTSLHCAVYAAVSAKTADRFRILESEVGEALERFDRHLGGVRFLLGDAIYNCDVYLFVILARFDHVYGPAFRLSRRRLTDFPNLLRHTAELYRRPFFKDTTDFNAINAAYYGSIPVLHYAQWPSGPADRYFN